MQHFAPLWDFGSCLDGLSAWILQWFTVPVMPTPCWGPVPSDAYAQRAHSCAQDGGRAGLGAVLSRGYVAVLSLRMAGKRS